MSRTRNARSILLLASAMLLVTAGPAWSQRPTPTAQQLLLKRVPVGVTLERYLETLRGEFLMADADSDGRITQRDVDLHVLMEGIQARTQAVSFVMRYDLDGDGFVTEDEVRRSMTYHLRSHLGVVASNKLGRPQLPGPDYAASQIDSTIRSIMVLDVDRDGRVSLAEAGKFNASPRGQDEQAVRARLLLSLDGAAKEMLTFADYEAAIVALFRQIDTDKDEVISQQELADYHKRAERVGCEMPAASEKAKVVLLSSFDTEALSNVTLGSQENAVQAGRVVVESGDEPLYVVIASHAPIIWQFSGAVERIERLIMTSTLSEQKPGDGNPRPLAGATGVAQEKVSFFNRPNCLAHFSEAPSATSLETVAVVRKASGKAPETVAARSSVAAFKVPSGGVDSLRGEPRTVVMVEKRMVSEIVPPSPRRAKDDMQRFWPGGVIEIDPKAVVGSRPAASYEVLPQEAGLVQLLASGAVKQNGLGEYIVREKIRFPAGLVGGHSVTFLIMKGTSYPEGDRGNSCVIMEESGEKKGDHCR